MKRLFAWSEISHTWIECRLISGTLEAHRELLRKVGRCTAVVK